MIDTATDTAADGTADRSPRLTALLAAAIASVYLLVIVGATTSLLDGASACGTWPTCDGRWLVPLDDPALLAVWLHRVGTLATGGVLAVAFAFAVRTGAPRRSRWALGAVLALYPVQIALGALVAVSGAPVSLATAHLVVGVTIFSGTLVALVRHLEGDRAADL